MSAIESAIKVCFIAPKAYPLFNPNIEAIFGGAEVDLYYLATELAKDERFDVTFLTADYGQEEVEIIENVKIIKTVDFKQNALTGAIKVWRGLKKAEAQMYLIKTISAGMFLVAFFCRLKRNIFLFRTSNTNSCDGTYLRQHPLLGRIYKLTLRTAKVVFVQNKSDARNIKKTTGVSAKVIANGMRAVDASEVERDIILWVGRSAEIKKPMRFVELAEKMPEERFTMICQRAMGDRNYKTLTERAKRAENLEFIERVRFDQIYGYFRRAKIFVNTSDAEGFPNTFIQACQCGTAIASLKVNPDGFIDEYECGICCRGQLGGLHEAVKSLLEDNKYVEMGENGRAYAEKVHNVKKIVEQYKEVFRMMS